jgi:hypothetical protein
VPQAGGAPRRWPRRTGIGLAIGLGVLVVLRALLPTALERYVNRVLDRSEQYEGSVGDVDVSLVRGAYTIEAVEIRKRNGRVPVPLLASERIDLSIEWRALTDGALVGEVEFTRPQINLVAPSRSAQQQTGAGEDWRAVVESLFPVKINRVEVHDGSVHLRAFQTDPKVDVYLHHVELVALNLTNSRSSSADRVAHLTMRATPMNAGLLSARAAFDPFAAKPDFDLDGEVTGADLAQWNDLLRAYLHFDVQQGGFSLYTELTASDDRFHGYLKPFFKNVDVLQFAEEREEQGLLASLWEGVVGTAAEIFQDHEHDRIATRIPISGTVEDPRLGFWVTLGNVVRNAFIESFEPELDRN